MEGAEEKEKEEEKPTVKKKREKGLGRTGVLECIPVNEDGIDIGEPISTSPTDNMVTVNEATLDTREHHNAVGGEGKRMCRYTCSYTCTLYIPSQSLVVFLISVILYLHQ